MMNFVYAAYGQEHVEMAVKSAMTAKHLHPYAQCTIYTDKSYDVVAEKAIATYNRVRPDLFNHPWMLANTMCQVDFLLSHGENDETFTVFLDNDVIVRNQLLEIPPADMWVTWRDNVGELSEQQPYNYGVLFVNHTVPAIRAMLWLEHRIMQLHPRRQKWYGNQIALRELVGPLRKDETVTREMGTFAVDVHQLPCHKFNWSPPTERLYQNAGDKVFVHLKGERKEAFNHYYQLVMNHENPQAKNSISQTEAS